MSEAMLWNIFYWGWAISEFVVLMVTHTRRSSGETRDRGSLLLLWPTIAIALSYGTIYGLTHRHTMFGGARWVLWASLALLVVGMMIRATAIITLGRSFSVNVAIHATQTVHKTGLYQYARHPSYTGIMLIFIAIGMQTRNWVALAIIVVPPMAALLYRIRVEERALSEAFGAEYVEYSQVTKRLIPGIF